MNKRNNCKKTYVFSLLRVFLVLFVALIVPRLYFTDYKVGNSGNNQLLSQENAFKLGLENISSEFLNSISFNGTLDYTVGLITNHTGLDQNGNRNIDILLAKGLHIKKIYIPEDDFLAYKKGINWEMIDDQTKIPIVMLPRIDSLKKAHEYSFNDVDILFFDIQDTGISPNADLITLVKTLQSVACQHKTMVVLDRPNILGSSMEGIIADGGTDRYICT